MCREGVREMYANWSEVWNDVRSYRYGSEADMHFAPAPIQVFVVMERISMRDGNHEFVSAQQLTLDELVEKHKDREWTRYEDDLGEVVFDGWSGLGELVGDLYGDMYERLKERVTCGCYWMRRLFCMCG